MTVDELHQTFASIADRFRDELRELQAALSEVIARTDAERQAAVQEAEARARTDAETRGQEQLTAALADAETRHRTAVEEALARSAADHGAAVDALATARNEAEARFAAELQEAVAAAEARAAKELQSAVQAAEERGRAAAAEEADSSWAKMSTEDTVPVGIPAWNGEERRARTPARPVPIDTVRALDRAASLTEILDALLMALARELPRVALLLRSGDELRGWRFVGFGSVCEPASSVIVLADGAGILNEAISGGAVVTTQSASAAPWFARVNGDGPRLAMPIVLGGEPVAVLYADNGEAPSSDHPSALPAIGETVEMITRHAARCLEAVTTLRAFEMTTRHGGTVARNRSAGRAESARAAADDAEEAARRYARLLVSEIKLYHEPAVVSGRRERDLSTRLGGEIARARALYDQRVPRDTRGESDYFHDELVRTLADGDASLLERTS
jgi:hypothetical protein